MMLKRFIILLAVLLLPACAKTELASHAIKKMSLPIPSSEKPAGSFKVGRSYVIKGQRYTPRETYNFTQTGIASWYGPNFHGKQTANGEVFDKYELTAAHKTLQMPSIIRVTNLENGRSMIVRVNDRGPFSKGRVLDLSERSAELLDFKHKGTARVKIEVLPQESRQVASMAKSGQTTQGFEITLNQPGYRSTNTVQTASYNPPPTKPSQKPIKLNNFQNPPQPIAKPDAIFVQAGSFQNVVKARALAERIKPYGSIRINPSVVNGNKYYRVQLGPLKSRDQANTVLAQLSKSNIGEPIIIRE
ncbi:MAG: septal ring lytic transglycosylase RlpA family protein [Bdellovibrionales bacterium]